MRVEALPRGDPNDNDNSAQIRQRGARGRAERDRRPGIDPQIRRHRGGRLHPCRHLCAGRDRAVAVDRAAADHRRAADAGAAVGGGRGDAGNLRADRPAAQLRQHRRVAAVARHRRRLQDLLRHGVAIGQDQSAADQPDAGDILQRADHGHRVRQPVAVDRIRAPPAWASCWRCRWSRRSPRCCCSSRR